jgi:hypothetical protein
VLKNSDTKHNEICACMSLGVYRGERERERVGITSNGGGVIMVIGRERPTVRSTNLRTKYREKEREREPSGLGKEGSDERWG